MNWDQNVVVYAFLFLVLLSGFTALKSDHLDNSLSSPHPMKYQRAVGPAMDMTQNGNPLRFVKSFKVNPANEKPGAKNYPHIPFREVGLAGFMAISPFSLQVTTHLFANLLGSIILLLFFAYTWRSFDERFAILSTAFLSMSYYMNLLSFATPQDTIMFTFFFGSLLTLEKYWETMKTKYLALAGFLAGLGFNAKYSIALILAPVTLALFYYKIREKSEYLAGLGGFYTAFVIPEILYRLFIQPIPSSSFYLIPTLIALVGLIPVFRRFGFVVDRYEFAADKILDDKKLLVGSIVSGILSFLGLFFFLGFDRYIGGFITLNPKLLFNLNVYHYMLVEQMKPLLTESVFYLGLFGLLLTPFSSLGRYQKVTIYSFVLGAITYWMVALKPVFFHMYYKFIFGVCFSLLSAVVIYEVTEFLEELFEGYSISKRDILSTSVGVSIVLMLTFSTVQPVIDSKFKSVDTGKAANYLQENTEKGEMFLRQGSAYVLSLPAKRKAVAPFILEAENVKGNITEKGFGEAMRDFSVKYFISRGKFDPNNLPNPYSNETNVQDIGDYRGALISHRVMGTEDPEYYTSSNSSFGERVEKFLELEKEIQGFFFYQIKESVNSSVSKN